jgi:hypothetical protein
MISSAPRPLLERTALVYMACAASFAIALLFIFVRAPHPWGWEGFDHYHEIALDLARGRPFPTMDVPWGYAYFLATFYWLFGDHPWIPLVAQASLNAAVPALVFRLADTWFDRPTAILAAVLTGLFSFNTVYASTQSSDAVCTCLFMAAIVAYVVARRRESGRWFAIVGVLSGIVPQFRPNLILVPIVLAGFALWERRSRRRAAHVAVMLVCAAAALLPWVIRNYRLTGLILPTSVHGAVQLWYGTLQVGPYLHSRAYNPRSLFDAPAFEYTSLVHAPIVVEGQVNCSDEAPGRVTLAYWSDRDRREVRLAPVRTVGRRYTFEIPAPGGETVVYYYFIATWSGGAGETVRTTPGRGPRTPLVYFVSTHHLADLDVYGDLIDVFDVVRLMRHEAWDEGLPFADRLRAAGAGDARSAAAMLMRRFFAQGADRAVAAIEHDDTAARMMFSDGSRMVVPRQWSGRITDLAFTEGAASSLMTSRVGLVGLEAAPARLSGAEVCGHVEDVAVNQVFYRREPHLMRRYSTLAADNIRRDPAGFALASAYRAVRLFVIEGTTDGSTVQQFAGSRWTYVIARAVSIVCLALFAIGVVIAWRRRHPVGLPLLLIAYIPATLAPVLTNMRYTVTVQPLMFMFIAVAIAAVFRFINVRSVRL